MTVDSLRSLLMEQLQDLYSAEEQINNALPGIIEHASDASLKAALTDHLSVTREQIRRLDQIFEGMAAEDRKATMGKSMESTSARATRE